MTPKILNSILLVSSFILYNYVVSPLYFGGDSILFSSDESVKSLVEKRKTYDATIEAVPNILAEATAATAQYNSISEEDRKKIFTMVPVSVDDIKLMSEVTKIGTESGTTLDGMGVKDKKGTYAVSFNVTTTYTNFKKIMEYWENSRRLFTLESLTFNPGKTEEDLIKFNVELSTYYMK